MEEQFVCVECGFVFSQPNEYYEHHGLDTPPYEHFSVCPHCGGAYVPAKRCDNCGNVITDDYIAADDGRKYCDQCYTMRTLDDDLY